jgi:hypothetical protein
LLGFLLSVTLFSLAVEVSIGGQSLTVWRSHHRVLLGGLAAAVIQTIVLVGMKRVTRSESRHASQRC